ncbi:MAG: tetratricopeptide repeat protein [Caulobacteraceae bacterium]
MSKRLPRGWKLMRRPTRAELRLRRADIAWRMGSYLEDIGDVKGAIEEYKIGAEGGNTFAQNCLATLLDDKIDPPDPVSAVYWYKRAVAKGDESAVWNLAMHHASRGRKRWYLYWLRRAKELGYEGADDELKHMSFWSGDGPHKSPRVRKPIGIDGSASR